MQTAGMLVLAFVGGLAGSLHCLTMCGGLVAILAAGGTGAAWRRVALYNVARVNTLVALGAAAGGLGTAIMAWAPVEVASRGLAVVGGLVAVLVGLEVLGVTPPRGRWLARRLHGGLGRSVRTLLGAPSSWTPIAFGTVNAFLPCHLRPRPTEVPPAGTVVEAARRAA